MERNLTLEPYPSFFFFIFPYFHVIQNIERQETLLKTAKQVRIDFFFLFFSKLALLRSIIHS